MSLIGKAICLFRERVGRRPVHAFVRRKGLPIEYFQRDESGEIPALDMSGIRVCTRCGLTVPVKPRKRKGAE